MYSDSASQARCGVHANQRAANKSELSPTPINSHLFSSKSHTHNSWGRLMDLPQSLFYFLPKKKGVLSAR